LGSIIGIIGVRVKIHLNTPTLAGVPTEFLL